MCTEQNQLNEHPKLIRKDTKFCGTIFFLTLWTYCTEIRICRMLACRNVINFSNLKALYSKTCQKEDQKLAFKTDYRLMQVKSSAECSKGSILQYFRPSKSLNYHLSLRSLFHLFLSGGLKQVLLYLH